MTHERSGDLQAIDVLGTTTVQMADGQSKIVEVKRLHIPPPPPKRPTYEPSAGRRGRTHPSRACNRAVVFPIARGEGVPWVLRAGDAHCLARAHASSRPFVTKFSVRDCPLVRETFKRFGRPPIDLETDKSCLLLTATGHLGPDMGLRAERSVPELA